jgi:hypothetical protein
VGWGAVRVVDRLSVSNEFLTFGGHFRAGGVNDMTVCVLESPVPLLRLGGHSQSRDPGASSLGAFFGRFRALADASPDLAREIACATPQARYAAFLADALTRFRRSVALRDAHPELFALLLGEERRIQQGRPVDWASGCRLSPVEPARSERQSSWR